MGCSWDVLSWDVGDGSGALVAGVACLEPFVLLVGSVGVSMLLLRWWRLSEWLRWGAIRVLLRRSCVVF